MLRKISNSAVNSTYKTSVKRLAGSQVSSAAERGKAVLQLIRFDPEKNGTRIESYEYDKHHDYMVLDLLTAVKAHQDPSLAFRSSCCEGVCGSCAMNINGINSLACITFAQHVTTVGPLPNFPVIKDFVVDLRHFFQQYSFIRPFVRNTLLHRSRVDGIVDRYHALSKSIHNVSPEKANFKLRLEGEHLATSPHQHETVLPVTSALAQLLEVATKAGSVRHTLLILEALEKRGVQISPETVKKYVEKSAGILSH